jgi:hypothetical protein
VDEDLFRVAVARLETRGIPYWIDAGTLLGLVRDGRIIPWDHDFDFGVMMPEVTERDVFAAFDPRQFSMHSLLPARGVHSCHLFSRGRRSRGKIDFTFYERQGDRAVHVTNDAPERLWSAALWAADRFLDPDHESEHRFRRQLHRYYHQVVAPQIPAPVRPPLRALVDGLCRRACAVGRRFVYDFPARYFETRVRARFLGVDVHIPSDATDYLREAYGPDWRTPKKFAHWYDGATRVEGWRERPRDDRTPLRT